MSKKRGRKPITKMDNEKPIPFSFSFNPSNPEDMLAFNNLRGWFEWCVQNFEAPKDGWSNNSMIKALLINLNNQYFNDEFREPIDFDLPTRMTRLEANMREELKSVRRMLADIQSDLSRKQFVSHNSYEPEKPTTSYVTDRYGSSEWNDDE